MQEQLSQRWLSCSCVWLQLSRTRISYICNQKTKKQRKIWQNEKNFVPLQPQYAHISNNK